MLIHTFPLTQLYPIHPNAQTPETSGIVVKQASGSPDSRPSAHFQEKHAIPFSYFLPSIPRMIKRIPSCANWNWGVIYATFMDNVDSHDDPLMGPGGSSVPHIEL